MQPSISTSKAFSYIRQSKRKEPGFQPDSDIRHKSIASDFHHLFRIPKIIRYFRVTYLTEKQFFSMNSFDLLHEQYGGDGLVINLIRKEADGKKIEEKVKSIGDPLSIVRFPDKMTDSLFDDELIRYGALKDMLLHGGNDSVVNREISLLIEETKEDIQALIDKFFGKDCLFYCCGVNSKDFIPALSKIMENVYYKSIIFNNELVNKDNVTTQYQKPINNVIDWVLNGCNEWAYSTTSPESTIREYVYKKRIPFCTVLVGFRLE